MIENDVDKRIQEIEHRMEMLTKEHDLMKTMLGYSGEDRVVPATEVYTEAKERSKDSTAIKSGIKGLDDILTGFWPGQLIITSGSTGSGKTQILEFLTWLISKNGGRCLWFNYELGDIEFFEKMPDDFKEFHMPKKMIHNKIAWIEERIIEGIAKFDTNVVLIDHMHFIINLHDKVQMQNASIHIGSVLRDLKRIAIERNVVIFLVSHMKKLESGKEPDINDMRDSSFVGQEADTVLMVLRDERKGPDGITHKTNQVAILVRKNRRTGKIGHINLHYNEHDKKFYENEIDATRVPPHDGDGSVWL